MILNIKELEKNTEYLLNIRDMMYRNLFFNNRFIIDKEDEQDLIKKYKKIMKISNLVYNNYLANINTLESISKRLYEKEKKVFLEMNQTPIKLILCIDNIMELIR